MLTLSLVACTPPGANNNDSGPNNNNNGNDAGDGCDPDDVARGVTVVVTDSVTSLRICNATITAVDGDFTEELQAFGAADDCEYFGLLDRGGSYTLDISAPDYGSATEATTVSLDACDHAITQELSFSLVPNDPPPPPPDGGPDPVDAGDPDPVDAGDDPVDAGDPGQDAGDPPPPPPDAGVDAGDAG
jgi:hypothetical protein